MDGRQVSVYVEVRSVAVDAGQGRRTTVSYGGIALTRIRNSHVEHTEWVPIGRRPTYADDEVLISALREALRWSR